MNMFCIWILYDAISFASLSIDVCVFFTRYSFRYLSLKLYISSIKMLLSYKVYGTRFLLRNNMFVLARRTTAILL